MFKRLIKVFLQRIIVVGFDPINNLVELYEVWRKHEKAEEWRAKLPQTEAQEQ